MTTPDIVRSLDGEQQLQEALRLGLTVVQELWYFSTRDWVTSVHAADIDGDGDIEVLVGSRDGSLRALTKKANRKWEARQVNEWIGTVYGINNIEAGDRTRVVVGTRKNNVIAYDETGQELWHYPINQVVRRVRVFDINNDDKAEVIVGSEDHCIYVLSCETGQLLWRYETNGWIRSVFTYDLDGDGAIEILAASGDKYLYILDSEGGLKSRIYVGSKVHSISVADIDKDGDAEILLGSDAKDLRAITCDGREKWRFSPQNRIHSINVVDIDGDTQDEVIAGSEDGHIYVLNNQGKLLWKHFLGHRIFSIYSVDLNRDGLWEILVGAEDNNVHVLRFELSPGLYDKILDNYHALGQPRLTNLRLSPTERALLRDTIGEPMPYEQKLTLAHIEHQLSIHDYRSALSDALNLEQQHVHLLWMKQGIGHIRSLATYEKPQGSRDIIIGTDEGDIETFDGSGKHLWKYTLEENKHSFEERIRTVQVVDIDEDGVMDILFGTTGGHVDIISDTGQEVKQRIQVGSWIESISTIVGDEQPEIIVGTKDKKIYMYPYRTSTTPRIIVTPQNVQVVRTYDLDRDGVSEIIVGGQDNNLYAYTREGTLLWMFETPDRVNALCIQDIDQDGRVEILFGSEDRNLYVLDDTGNLKWRYCTPHRVLSVHIVEVDHTEQVEIFIGCGNGMLYTLNSVGDVLWQFETDDRIRALCGADINGDGIPELLVGTEDRLFALQVLGSGQLHELIEQCWNALLESHSQQEVFDDLIHHEDATLRAFALTRIVQQPMLTGQHLHWLDFLLKDDTFEVRKAFVASLLPLYLHGYAKFRFLLETLATDRQREIRLALIEHLPILARQNTALGFEFLDRFTRSVNLWIRRAVVRQLDRLFISHPQEVLRLLLTLIQEKDAIHNDAVWIQQEAARVLAHYLDAHRHSLIRVLRLLLAKELEADLLKLIIYCSEEYDTKHIFGAFYALHQSLPTADIIEKLGNIVEALRPLRSLPCGESMYNVYNELHRLHCMRTINDIAQYTCSLTNSCQLHPFTESDETHFDDTFNALQHINTITGILRLYLRRRGLGESISSLMDAIAEVDTLTHDMKQTYFRWCKRQDVFPDSTLFHLLLIRWRGILANELASLRGKAELMLELQTQKAQQEERVGIVLCISNKGRSPADRVAVALQPGDDYTIVSHEIRHFETISPLESVQAEFTIMPHTTTFRPIFGITYDDAEAKGKFQPFADSLELVVEERIFERLHNPYSTGKPVQDKGMFYGREEEVAQLQEDFVYSLASTVVVLYGQRRSGKSSLLFTLHNGNSLDPHIPVLIDMQHETLNFSTSRFLRDIAQSIWRALHKHHITIQQPQRAAFDEDASFALDVFLDDVEMILNGRKLIMLIDEFEILEEKVVKQELSPDIFTYLRSLMQIRSFIHFLLAGTHTIKELTEEYWSVFFNIAVHRRLTQLTPEAAQQLITQPVKQDIYDPLAIEKIRRLAGDQPYFIQLFCHELIQHANMHRKAYLTINDVNIVQESVIENGNAHFSWIWKQATQEERAILAIIAQESGEEGNFVSLADIERLYHENRWLYKREQVLYALRNLCLDDVLKEVEREDCFKIPVGLMQTWLREAKPLRRVILEENLFDWS